MSKPHPIESGLRVRMQFERMRFSESWSLKTGARDVKKATEQFHSSGVSPLRGPIRTLSGINIGVKLGLSQFIIVWEIYREIACSLQKLWSRHKFRKRNDNYGWLFIVASDFRSAVLLNLNCLSIPMTTSSPITLYRGFDDQGEHVWSPFVIKLEFRLRHAGLSYVTSIGNPRQGPSGKIPYIDVAPLNNSPTPHLLGDSSLIIRHMISNGHLRDLNSSLSHKEKASDLGLRSLVEDKLYFYGGRERWIDNFYVQREKILASLPYPVRVVVGNIIYRRTVATLEGQGTGRYTDEELDSLRNELWSHLNGLLTESKEKSSDGVEPFWALGGKDATEADASLYGFIVSGLIVESGPKTREIVKGYPVLVNYAKRIQNKYFADYKPLPV
ncbi:hypothetical protein PROFUN_02748 [Planoprotostelium fungivorum]|uniref:Thioredoxin-like fold domain-containing protein n=1 Tax=Planoprotostelium fungivorum TaxID=1890364 RepID=A0A2P6NXG6_9EUKA|nr:hypothetical protein PROFUN_02748 [Planoprotostelium fungivorum]